MAGSLSARVQNEMVAMLAEFVGTFMFLVFAYGATTAVNIAPATNGDFLGSDPSRLLYISLAFGLSLAVNAVSLPICSYSCSDVDA
jgi:aquaporin related protein